MTVLTANQIYPIAIAAGFTGDDAVMATAVGLAESSGNTNATHKNSNGSTDYGLMQINSVHAGNAAVLAVSPGFFALNQWTDPTVNMRVARVIFVQAGSFKPWVTFQEGDTNNFLTQARAAAGAGSNGSNVSGGGNLKDTGNTTTPAGVVSEKLLSQTVDGHRVAQTTYSGNLVLYTLDNGDGYQFDITTGKNTRINNVGNGAAIADNTLLNKLGSILGIPNAPVLPANATDEQKKAFVASVASWSKQVATKATNPVGSGLTTLAGDALGALGIDSHLLWIAAGGLLVLLGVLLMAKSELLPAAVRKVAP